MPAIEVDGLVVRYESKLAVDGLSMHANAASVVTLLGPNGAGKTSTVEVMEGYRKATAGTVRVLGLDPATQQRELARRIGVMLQRGGVYPTMPAGEAVRLFARYYRQPEDPGELLERVGLASVASTPWKRLSGGEQQRLSLALALVGRPEVVFLDEPTAGVDPEGRLAIREVISGLRAAGVCVILTTHELEEAERLSDEIVIIDKGRVVAAGSPADLTTATSGSGIRFAAPTGIDVAALGAAVAATTVEERPGEYVVETEPNPSSVAAITAWLAEHDLPLSDLRAGREKLEDVFLRLTGDHGSERRGA